MLHIREQQQQKEYIYITCVCVQGEHFGYGMPEPVRVPAHR